MEKLRNKRGDGYVFPCVLIVIISMILSVFVFFASTISMVRLTKENTKIVLDSYIMKNSIEIYNSIKQGSDYTQSLDRDVYINDLCKFCTLEKGINYLYAYDEDGNLKYRMTYPVITFREENRLKIELNYTLYVPVRFDGKIVRYAIIPITVDSSFSEKF